MTNHSGSALVANHEGIVFELDGGIGHRANFGLVVLRTEQTIEDDFRFILPADGVALYVSRINNDSAITPETLARMSDLLPDTVAHLPEVPFDVIAYACTSGALVIGEDKIAERIHETKPGVRVTNPLTAGCTALAALGAHRVALLTPYIAEINHSLRASLMERGVNIPVMGSFNEQDDNTVPRISPDSIERAILELGSSSECDAVFVSCTSLRVTRIIERVEQKLGKPVTSSNHALAWHMCRLSGITEGLSGRGELFLRSL